MIPSSETHLIVAAKSHSGKKRTNNEDRYLLASYRTEPDGLPIYLAMVADGIGGHQAGEVAAELTVDTIQEGIKASINDDPLESIRAGVIEAGRVVLAQAEEQPDYKGMGSTVVIALLIEDRIYTGSVGDSRIYILQDGHLHQATVDHTWVQEAVDYGIIPPDEAKNHPQSHVLRRHIGGKEIAEPDFRLRLRDAETDQQSVANQGTRLSPGDKILLCSDGLTDLVEDMEILQIVRSSIPDQAATRLVNLALDRGGDDNVTVVIIGLPNGEEPVVQKRKWPWIVAVLLASLILIGISLIAVLAMQWLQFGG